MTEPADTPRSADDAMLPTTTDTNAAARRAHERFMDAYFGKDVPFEEPAAAGPADGSPPYSTTRVVAIDRRTMRENRLVNGHDPAELADVFRILRTHVIKRLRACGASTLAITSAGMSEGKTLIAANLAISLSQIARHTVLLVDLDLRRPSLHKVFGIAPEPGLTDYLLQDAPLSECLVNPGFDRLVLLPSGAPLLASSETLSSDKMAALAAELKSRYPNRLVLYDLPPLLLTDDALVFLNHVDASLLVFAEGQTRRGDIERALELLKDHQPIGTVMNKARWTQTLAGYY
ncbi:MAG: hypothetical protein MUE49_09700 [Rhodospirillales bacterium]|nr:hypothetical protein [Rhodospirillales bacterium]